MGPALEIGPEPAAPASTRLRGLRAAAVAAIWLLGALPAAVGRARCPVATLFARPCPGCGMTRAARLLLAGDLAGSLHMHPLAAPSALASLAFALATVWVTFETGSPIDLYKYRAGRLAIAFFVVVSVSAIVLWILRWFGAFGGPVPV